MWKWEGRHRATLCENGKINNEHRFLLHRETYQLVAFASPRVFWLPSNLFLLVVFLFSQTRCLDCLSRLLKSHCHHQPWFNIKYPTCIPSMPISTNNAWCIIFCMFLEKLRTRSHYKASVAILLQTPQSPLQFFISSLFSSVVNNIVHIKQKHASL